MSNAGANESTPLKADGSKLKSPVLLQEPVTWMRTLVQTYSWKLLAMVACTNHLLKGFVYGGGDGGLVGAPMEFIFKEHRVHAGDMQVYMAIATSPWALKPLIGLLSDSCPVLGYRKLPYILASSVCGLVGVATLAVSGHELSMGMLILCLFMAFLMVATADLLVEAKQSEEIKDSAELGPDFFLFTWLGIVVAMILSTLLVGPLITHWSPYACYAVAIPCMLPFLVPSVMNFIGEKRLPEGETMVSRLTANIRNHPIMFWLCLFIGALIGSLSAITLSFGKDEKYGALVAVVGAAILLSAIAYCIRLEMALPLIFWFLLQSCPQVNGALFYFYTDDAKAFPGGPDFSPWMYATGMGVAGLFGVFTGYLTGSVLFKSWRYTSILFLTVPARVLVRLLLVPVLWRWNRNRYQISGVPDAYADALWVLPMEFLSSMLFAWSWVPKQVMSAHLTPKGNEATMLALSAGTFNLGSIISSYLGCWMLSKFEVCPDGDSGDAGAMERLWRPYVISVLTPVLVLVLLPAFIPHKLQTEVLITEHPESCTYGSFSQRNAASNAEQAASPI